MKRQTDNIQSVGLVANPAKVSSRALVRKAAALIQEAGRALFCDHDTARLADLQCASRAGAGELARRVDLLVVFGGDGTMLQVARQVAGLATPILGVKVGGLGFLTHVQSRELAGALQKVWAGEFEPEIRPLIEAGGTAKGQPVAQRALNDFVISRGGAPRLIDLRVWVDRELLTDYRCDGLIISSPTGSTAYSLAAGGAIVSPAAEVLTLTPICPHTLSNRSVIVPLAAAVKVQVLSERVETLLSADGQVQVPLDAGDTVTVRRSRATVRLVNLGNTSFFDTLQRKLNWSGTNV